MGRPDFSRRCRVNPLDAERDYVVLLPFGRNEPGGSDLVAHQ